MAEECGQTSLGNVLLEEALNLLSLPIRQLRFIEEDVVSRLLRLLRIIEDQWWPHCLPLHIEHHVELLEFWLVERDILNVADVYFHSQVTLNVVAVSEIGFEERKPEGITHDDQLKDETLLWHALTLVQLQ